MPKPFRYGQWIDFALFPPSPFIAGGMIFTMMDRAKRNRKFITYLQGKPSRLRESHMMRMRRCATADQAGLLANKPEVFPGSDPLRLADDKDAFIDPCGQGMG